MSFNFNQIPFQEKRKGAFIGNIKDGLVVKTATKWLPTHKLYKEQPLPFPEHWCEKIINLVSEVIDNENKSPTKNGALTQNNDYHTYKWIDCKSSAKHGMIGIQFKDKTQRLEITEESIFGLYDDKMYKIPLPESLKQTMSSILLRTPNSFKGNKVNKELSTGNAEKNALKEFNARYVVGVDESGRGSWAGPLVASAALLDINNIPQSVSEVKDSKALLHDEIEILSTKLKKDLIYGIGVVNADEINTMNLDEANKLAFERALEDLYIKTELKPDIVLLDGMSICLDNHKYKTLNIAQGEGESQAIASASIIAKDYHDKEMLDLHFKYPAYDFKSNKGYGTPTHKKLLERYGVSEHHRTNFKPIKKLLNQSNQLDLL